MSFFSKRCFRTLGWVAMVVGGMFATKANAGIVLTTGTLNTDNAFTNVSPYPASIGDQMVNFTNNAGTNYGWGTPGGSVMGIRFTTGAVTAGYKLNSLSAAWAFEAGNTTGSWTNATIRWRLYDSTSATPTVAVATYNTQWGALTTGENNTRLDKTFNLTGTSFTLASNRTYNLVFDLVTVSGGANLSGGDIHWLYTNTGTGTSPKSSTDWSAVTPGDFTYQGGTGNNPVISGVDVPTNPTTNQMINFSLDATAVPEPSTMILYSAAAGGFFLFTFLRYRKSKTPLAPVVA